MKPVLQRQERKRLCNLPKLMKFLKTETDNGDILVDVSSSVFKKDYVKFKKTKTKTWFF